MYFEGEMKRRKEQFNLALSTSDKLHKGLLANINDLIKFINVCYKRIRNK
jgi:hypothetical protein